MCGAARQKFSWPQLASTQTQASSPPNIVKDRERVTRIVDGVPHAVTDFSILFCVVLAGLPNKSLFN